MEEQLEKIIFEDLPSTKTPINSSNLNNMQDNIETAIQNVVKKSEEAIEEKQSYTMDEKKIGTWIDGKTIYRKCFTGTLHATEKTTLIEVPNIKKLINDSFYLSNDDNIFYKINGYNSGDLWGRILNSERGIQLQVASGFYGFNFSGYAEYTKTTD